MSQATVERERIYVLEETVLYFREAPSNPYGRPTPAARTLYYGDNLDILRDKIADQSVNLIYLDPPFQSGRNYNQIFQPEEGATAQIQAFEDTWKWGPEAEHNYHGLIMGEITREKPTQKLIDLIKAMRSYLGEVPMMAYLSMMAPRLLEMHRVLKDTGSIYLHCDPTASHYLKLLMDAVFGPKNFVNEIVWCYTGPRKSKSFARKHDIILFYSKTEHYIFNEPRVPHKSGVHNTGQVFGSECVGGGEVQQAMEERGKLLEDWWVDIWSTDRYRSEFIGYPTQKPEKLLERIIRASSNEGDVVLDPFCGCGTAIAVSQKLRRRWIGIDVTYLAIDVIAKRLEESGLHKNTDFVVEGEPTDAYSAEKLAQENWHQFQLWCVARLNATPMSSRSNDHGVDGILNFVDFGRKDHAGKGIIQVKGTQTVNPGMVRDLKGTIASQGGDFGILVTLKKRTHGMLTEAVKDGHYTFGQTGSTMQQKIPKIQFLTAEELFYSPLPVMLPPTSSILSSFKKPPIEETKDQTSLF